MTNRNQPTEPNEPDLEPAIESTEPEVFEPEPDPHLEAAIEEEQSLLQKHIQEVVREEQARYLINRCIQLNAAARSASDPENTN